MEKQKYDRMTLKYLKISSYMKLCAAAGFAIGLLLAVFRFGMALINVIPAASVGSVILTGFSAALVILIVTPFLYSFYAIVFSMISYFPLMLILRRMRGITLEGVFEESAEEEKQKEGEAGQKT